MTEPAFHCVLAAARAGEPWACARIHDELSRAVLGYVRLRGVPDPDDVTSEVFLCVFRDLHRFEGDEEDLRAWVFTIAHRRVLDAWRRAARRPAQARFPHDLDVAGGDAEDDAFARLGLDRVEELLRTLTPAQRDVVLLRVLADLSLEQVAEATGRSVVAVKALQHRALDALRRTISQTPASRPPGRAIRGTR